MKKNRILKLLLLLALVVALVGSDEYFFKDASREGIIIQKSSEKPKPASQKSTYSEPVTTPVFTYSADQITKISYGLDQPVFKFDVAADAKGDIALRRISLNVLFEGLNDRPAGLGRERGWRLIDETVDAKKDLSKATLDLENGHLEFDLAYDAVIFKGTKHTFRVEATVMDSDTEKPASLTISLSKDIREDVDFEEEGTQKSAEYYNIDDSSDLNQIIWRESTGIEDLSEYRNSYSLEVETTPYILSNL